MNKSAFTDGSNINSQCQSRAFAGVAALARA